MEEINIQKFKSGDEDLFREIVDAYGERLYYIIMRIVRNVDDAEDIVQETFVRAYTKRRTFKGKSSLYTWLVRIAYNLSINRVKKAKPTISLDPRMASKSNPQEEVERSELSRRIENAIQQLPPRQKAVFSLRFYENMPYKEVSKFLKCREGTAKALYHFAVEKLSYELRDLVLPKTENNTRI